MEIGLSHPIASDEFNAIIPVGCDYWEHCEEEDKKLKGEDGWTKVPGRKAKLPQKPYGIVALEIPIAEIEKKKSEETKEEIHMQNASICIEMKIETILLFPHQSWGGQ